MDNSRAPIYPTRHTLIIINYIHIQVRGGGGGGPDTLDPPPLDPPLNYNVDALCQSKVIDINYFK